MGDMITNSAINWQCEWRKPAGFRSALGKDCLRQSRENLKIQYKSKDKKIISFIGKRSEMGIRENEMPQLWVVEGPDIDKYNGAQKHSHDESLVRVETHSTRALGITVVFTKTMATNWQVIDYCCRRPFRISFLTL